MSEADAKRAVLMKEDLGSQLYSARVKKVMAEQGISQKEAEAIVTQQRIDEDPFYFQTQAYDAEGKADINTPEFKEWSGGSDVVMADQTSKAYYNEDTRSIERTEGYVFETGKPVTVEGFHGTNETFSVFDPEKIGQNATYAGGGFYSTNVKKEASGYGKPMDLYFTFRSPLVLRQGGEDISQEQRQQIIDYLNSRGKIRKLRDGTIMGDDASFLSDIFSDIEYENRFEDYKDALKNVLGIDGIIFENGSSRYDKGLYQYVAFDPNQIKSVYNKGTWSKDNNDIYYQARELAKEINRIDAEKLEFERKDINPELKGREQEEVKAVKINRFFADRTKGSDITDEEVIAKLDETVTRNENGVRVLQNDNGETATLSNGSIKEMLSVGKTDDNIGGIVNKEAIANLPALFKTAIKVKETEDLRHNRDNRIVRYANVFESNGEPIMVKITVKSFGNNHRQLTDIEFENNGKRDLSAYSLKTAKKNTVADDLRASPADKSYGNNNGDSIIVDDLIEYVNTYTDKEIDIDGVQRSTRNSDGSRIAKTEEGLRAFYKWFGDSKVVDDKGRPLVMWHGTRFPYIRKFKSKYDDKLVFFSYEEQFAKDWAKHSPLTPEQEEKYSFHC